MLRQATRGMAYLCALVVLLFVSASIHLAGASQAAAPARAVHGHAAAAAPLQSKQPTAAWAHRTPYTVAYHQRQDLLFIGATTLQPPYVAVADALRTAVVYKLQASSQRTLANLSLPDGVELTGMCTSASALWLMTVQRSSSSYAVLEVNIASLAVVHSTPVSSQGRLYGVDSAGDRVLIGLASYQYVWLVSSADGRLLQQLDGGRTKLEVLAAAYLPGSGDVLIADVTSASLLRVRANNTVASSSPLPLSRQTYAVSMSADEAHGSVYLFWWDVSDGAYVFTHFDLSSHAVLGRLQLNGSNWPLSYRTSFTQGIAAAGEPGALYFADANTATVQLRSVPSGTVRTVQLDGNPPWMRWPTDVVTLDGRVYVATNAFISGTLTPWQGIVAMDANGRPVAQGAAWDVEGCRFTAGQQLAAGKDSSGAAVIVAGRCNGTVAVYNAALERTAVIRFPQRNVRLLSIALSRGAVSMFIIDAGQADVVAEYDLQGELLRTLQASPAAGAFSDVAFSAADGSIWATDGLNGALYHWASNGSLLSSRSFGHLHELWSVAIDPVHHRLLVSENLWSDDGRHGRYQRLSANVLWLDMDTGGIVDTFTYPNGDQATGVAVSEDGGRVYTSAFLLSALFVFEQHQSGDAWRAVAA